MEEFASALLVGLVRSELARRGIDPAVPPVPIAEAKVPLALKRVLLSRVAATHGLVPLMEVGRGLSRLPPDPVIAALTRATDPHDALARWQRLEGFLHSRHRIVIEEAGNLHAVLRHAGPEGATPPQQGEDALILGVMAELCRVVGAADLHISMIAPGGTECEVFDGDHFAEPPSLGAGETGLWRFVWTGVEPPSGDHTPEVPPCNRAEPSQVAAMVAGAVSADLGRAWSLPALAQMLALSERTLQRRLADAGANLSALVRSARVQAAGRLLIGTNHSLARIGFACGFADQPHFTNLFRRHTAMTPAAYRRAFAR